MATKKLGALDAMVGARIRVLRVNRGMSQTALAARIGVTFQQVQQYEQGAGRVGASRLARIASVLEVSVGEFFESSRTGPLSARSPVHPLAESGSATRDTAAYLNTVQLSERRKYPSRR